MVREIYTGINNGEIVNVAARRS